LLNENNYEKGAWVLHMLRRRLGDAAFFQGLRNYYQAHREANATTEDLRRALEGSSGKNLQAFFARWVYGAGHPIYEVSAKPAAAATGRVTVRLKQTQTGPAFFDPVPIEFIVNGKPQQQTIFPKGKLTTKSIRLEAHPTSIQVDPNSTLLKEVVTRPVQEVNLKLRYGVSTTRQRVGQTLNAPVDR